MAECSALKRRHHQVLTAMGPFACGDLQYVQELYTMGLANGWPHRPSLPLNCMCGQESSSLRRWSLTGWTSRLELSTPLASRPLRISGHRSTRPRASETLFCHHTENATRRQNLEPGICRVVRPNIAKDILHATVDKQSEVQTRCKKSPGLSLNARSADVTDTSLGEPRGSKTTTASWPRPAKYSGDHNPPPPNQRQCQFATATSARENLSAKQARISLPRHFISSAAMRHVLSPASRPRGR